MGNRGSSNVRRQGWAALGLGAGVAVALCFGPAPEVAQPSDQQLEEPVAYVVDASVSRATRASVRAAMRDLANRGDAIFVRRTSEETYLDITAGPRCSADSPEIEGARAVRLGTGCSSAAGAAEQLRTALGLGVPAE